MTEEMYKKIYSNTENLTSREIANRYEDFMGIPITVASVRDYMRKHDIKYKKQTHKGMQKNDR
jgi:transposase